MTNTATGDRRLTDKMTQLIAAEPDHDKRQLLALIAEMFSELRTMLTVALSDTGGLRNAVLNGHADHFHDNMEWVKTQREQGCDHKVQEHDAQLQEINEWMDKCKEHQCLDVCMQMKEEMAERKEDESVERGEKIKAKFSMTHTVINALLSALVALVIWKITGSVGHPGGG